jgi:PAS domain S-box-containing protein
LSRSFAFEWETATDRVLRSNNCAPILGVSDAEVMHDTGQKYFQRVHPDDRERFVKMLSELKPKADTYQTQYRVLRGDGTTVVLEEYARGFFDDKGKLRRLVGVTIDITERKKAEDGLKQFAEELKRSNSDLEQFAYVASHDLREPLRAINGFMELLYKGYKDKLDEKAIEYIRYATDGAIRMDDLLNGLLRYSRVQTHGKAFAQTPARGVLRAALKNLQRIIDETGACITSDELPAVKADGIQITELLQNLIANAIKFRSDKKPEIHVGCQKKDGCWQFFVRDNGIGIDPQFNDRIFLMFQRLHTRDKYPGYGVGLSVCKRIIERHGGKIWVESQPGNGATFYFTIPE